MSTIVFHPTAEQVFAAAEWHGGQASVLYQVASTGSVSVPETKRALVLAEQAYDALTRLSGELGRALAECDGSEEYPADHDTLTAFLAAVDARTANYDR